jgi:hypothetical protein
MTSKSLLTGPGEQAMATLRTIRLLTATIALALAVGLGAIVPAYASSTTKTDPRNDVFLTSVGGGIDLAAVQLATLDRKKRIRVTFRLHSRALQGSLQQPGGMRVTFIKDKRTSRVVTVVTEDGVLRAEVCSNSRGRKLVEPYDCSSLPVTQVDATTYRALVKRKQVKEGATVLKWTAASIDLSNGYPVSDQLTAKNGEPFRWRL